MAESRVDAWWDGGPQIERREDGEDVVTDNRGRGADDGDGGGDGGGGGGSGGPG
jgi:hypothetical protein